MLRSQQAVSDLVVGRWRSREQFWERSSGSSCTCTGCSRVNRQRSVATLVNIHAADVLTVRRHAWRPARAYQSRLQLRAVAPEAASALHLQLAGEWSELEHARYEDALGRFGPETTANGFITDAVGSRSQMEVYNRTRLVGRSVPAIAMSVPLTPPRVCDSPQYQCASSVDPGATFNDEEDYY